jgi:hypothetical protein
MKMEKITVRKIEDISTTGGPTLGVLEYIVTLILSSMGVIFGADVAIGLLPSWLGMIFSWVLGPW